MSAPNLLRVGTVENIFVECQDCKGGDITIPAEEFSRDPTVKQYVYLQAQFPDKLLEKVVLVSFQSGYIFIQTDKTLYTPNSRRESVLRNSPNSESRYKNTPEDINFPVDIVSLNSGIHSGYYQLPDIV
ncbi:hypothetical protein INR49_026531, partial [Caranx melampygus]